MKQLTITWDTSFFVRNLKTNIVELESDAVFYHHYLEMKDKVDKMTKLEPIKTDNFSEVHNYFLDKSI